MPNPIYHFFASRAGMAGSLLRWTMAGFLLFYAAVQSQAWWQGLPLTTSSFLLTWLVFPGEASWVLLAGKATLGALLLVGLFTRLCALVLLGIIGWVLFGDPRPEGPALRELLLSASLCFALMVAGAGRFSLDRRISNFFLPNFG
jgi:uncharacterized membrane protein YphA (DoxX/SURF4 family)